MKQRFEQFLLEKRVIINRAIKRYPIYNELIYTKEDYLRMCEFVLYRIWKDDLFIDKENRDGYIFMECCNILKSRHRETYNSGKNKLHMEALRFDIEYDEEGSKWEAITAQSEKGYNNVDLQEIWSIVRKVLKNEKYFELFIEYYKSGCKSMTDFHKKYNPPMKYEAMRRFFDKYIKILRENRGYFIDFV